MVKVVTVQSPTIELLTETKLRNCSDSEIVTAKVNLKTKLVIDQSVNTAIRSIIEGSWVNYKHRTVTTNRNNSWLCSHLPELAEEPGDQRLSSAQWAALRDLQPGRTTPGTPPTHPHHILCFILLRLIYIYIVNLTPPGGLVAVPRNMDDNIINCIHAVDARLCYIVLQVHQACKQQQQQQQLFKLTLLIIASIGFIRY